MVNGESLFQLEKFAAARFEAGRYNSASKVVREALRLLEEYDQNRAERRGEFNQELGRRLGSPGSGRHVSPTEAHDPLKRKSERCRNPRRERVAKLGRRVIF